MRACIAQINTTVGDLRGNRDKVLATLRLARRGKADLVLFPEMTLPGYPPEDLLFKKNFVDDNRRMLRSLVRESRGLMAVVGFVDRDAGGRLYNAAAVLAGGRQIACYRKNELPNYGVFDEKRYFEPSRRAVIVIWKGLKIGLSICEDIWQPRSLIFQEPYRGLSILLNLSASPYHRGKQRFRERLLSRTARSLDAWTLYDNLVGGQDELVFDGGSLVVAPSGRIVARGALFQEDLVWVDLPAGRVVRRGAYKKLSADAETYRALVLGTRDYIDKNRFKKVLIGLSGGIDSALVARVAVDALGPDRVLGVTMPSRYTSPHTLRDALVLARRLGIVCHRVPIEGPHAAVLNALDPLFDGLVPDSTEENIQARLRGTLLMALSNKFGHLVLTTGNKSEFATGYCTLYGDMAGGFAVLKDVPKTLVFRLSRYRNRLSPRGSIPGSILRRPPSAELRPDQKDQDSLPPYPLLDAVLRRYVENDHSAGHLLRGGFSPALVKKVLRLVDRSEYKRRQAPPGVKITPKAFGRDRRMPITQRYSA